MMTGIRTYTTPTDRPWLSWSIQKFIRAELVAMRAAKETE